MTPTSNPGVVNDLITRCVAEEEKLKKEKGDSVFLMTNSKPNSAKGKR